MCGGRPTPPPPPQRIAIRPALRPAPKPRRVPQPEEIRKEREDPNIITGKKKTPQELLKVKEGVKAYPKIINIGKRKKNKNNKMFGIAINMPGLIFFIVIIIFFIKLFFYKM